MPIAAPLKVTIEIDLASGKYAGERRYRLSDELALPPRLYFREALPLEGEGEGRVFFRLPDGEAISCGATLVFDPESSDERSSALLLGLDDTQKELIERYVAERNEQ